MSTFHPFPRLPTEIRLQIWEMTVVPRTVEIHIAHERMPPSPSLVGWRRYPEPEDLPYLVSPTPVPAILQTCCEARNLGLYQKALSELAGLDGAEPRYVWLDLEIDMISIGIAEVWFFMPVVQLIRRLKMEPDVPKVSFADDYGLSGLRHFVNAREIHVVCADGLRSWYRVSELDWWPCSRENLFFIDPDNGTIVRSIEMDAMFDKILEEEERWWGEEEEEEEEEDNSWTERL
ncbi:hypothetical protein F5Y10DRAFT_290218 [Nemania abortiva]|nr:hypothetical protein F5Y10DRAFT_290218 [Nemania abortiva]